MTAGSSLTVGLPVLERLAGEYLYEQAIYAYEEGSPEPDERLAYYEGRLDGAIEALGQPQPAEDQAIVKRDLLDRARSSLISGLRRGISALRGIIIRADTARSEMNSNGETADDHGLSRARRATLRNHEDALDHLLATTYGLNYGPERQQNAARYEVSLRNGDSYLPLAHFYTREVAKHRCADLQAGIVGPGGSPSPRKLADGELYLFDTM